MLYSNSQCAIEVLAEINGFREGYRVRCVDIAIKLYTIPQLTRQT
jgi:hypothetical protein